MRQDPRSRTGRLARKGRRGHSGCLSSTTMRSFDKVSRRSSIVAMPSRSWPRPARSKRPWLPWSASFPTSTVDVRLLDGSGIEACREIRAEHPEIRVVMLTSYPDEEAVLSGIVAGASGYLLKQVRARDLVAALEAVGRGESLLDPAVTEVLERVRRIATSAYTDEFAQLTAQEQKILPLVAEGKTNKEIAAEVFLSDKTVKNYVSSILSKLNLQRRAQAAAYVAKHKPGSSLTSSTGACPSTCRVRRPRRPPPPERQAATRSRHGRGCPRPSCPRDASGWPPARG